MLRAALCRAACRGYGEPEAATGVAAAVELLHAFSLVHDDIEDGDRERRGRPTLWTIAGVPLAINAGDSLFALAQRALIDAAADLPRERGLAALRIFSDACLRMIEGQHLDIAFESRSRVGAAEYIEMSRRKTGALLGASLALGALAGGAPEGAVAPLGETGVELGLAFQAVDDALAVWGDPARTGKAVGNDLARGKKSLPLVLAIDRGLDPARAGGLETLREELELLGVREEVRAFARARAGEARRLMAAAGMSDDARDELDVLIEFILAREG
jgi:geranylgeranyl diphosphate synthase type I